MIFKVPSNLGRPILSLDEGFGHLSSKPWTSPLSELPVPRCANLQRLGNLSSSQIGFHSCL